MATKDCENILAEKGISLTPNRVLVTRELSQASGPLSMSELEMRLDSLDKSSIFRVLTLLTEHDLVHAFEDGRGIVKYELCHAHDHEEDDDLHCHFYCTSCRETFCLPDVKVPEVNVPQGFRVKGVNFMLKGICPKCGSKGVD